MIRVVALYGISSLLLSHASVNQQTNKNLVFTRHSNLDKNPKVYYCKKYLDNFMGYRGIGG